MVVYSLGDSTTMLTISHDGSSPHLTSSTPQISVMGLSNQLCTSGPSEFANLHARIEPFLFNSVVHGRHTLAIPAEKTNKIVPKYVVVHVM